MLEKLVMRVSFGPYSEYFYIFSIIELSHTFGSSVSYFLVSRMVLPLSPAFLRNFDEEAVCCVGLGLGLGRDALVVRSERSFLHSENES